MTSRIPVNNEYKFADIFNVSFPPFFFYHSKKPVFHRLQLTTRSKALSRSRTNTTTIRTSMPDPTPRSPLTTPGKSWPSCSPSRWCWPSFPWSCCKSWSYSRVDRVYPPSVHWRCKVSTIDFKGNAIQLPITRRLEEVGPLAKSCCLQKSLTSINDVIAREVLLRAGQQDDPTLSCKLPSISSINVSASILERFSTALLSAKSLFTYF